MYQSFDQYPGPPQNYTVAMVRADFPFGVSRLSSFNELKKGGFTFSKGHGRGYVGNGMLRNTHPQGAARRTRCLLGAPHAPSMPARAA